MGRGGSIVQQSIALLRDSAILGLFGRGKDDSNIVQKPTGLCLEDSIFCYNPEQGNAIQFLGRSVIITNFVTRYGSVK